MFAECISRTNLLIHYIDSEDDRPERFNPRPLSVRKKALLDQMWENRRLFPHFNMNWLAQDSSLALLDAVLPEVIHTDAKRK